MAYYAASRWNDKDLSLIERHTYTRRDYAASKALQLVYDTLKAFGKLDTQAAHNVMGEAIKKFNSDIMPIGSEIHITISNTGQSVILKRHK